MKRSFTFVMLVVAMIGWADASRAEEGVRLQDRTPPPMPPLSESTPVDPATKSAQSVWGEDVETRLYGQVGYIGPEASFHPAPKIEGTVWQTFPLDLGDDQVVGHIVTDENGVFDLVVAWEYIGLGPFGNSEIYIVVRTQAYSKVVNPATGVPYEFTMRGEDNDDHTLMLFGTYAVSSEVWAGALHFLARAALVSDFMDDQWGESIRNYDIRFPDEDAPPAGAFVPHDESWARLHLPLESAWRDDHLFRLLGHKWNRQYGTRVDQDLCNGVCDGTGSDCDFCEWCLESPTAAWNEGFALSFANEMTRRLDDGMSTLQLHDFEEIQPCAGSIYTGPTGTPGYVAALLEDLSDPPNYADDHLQYPGLSDAVGGLWPDLMTVLRNQGAADASTVLVQLISAQPSLKAEIWETGANCGFNVDTVAPPGVDLLTSSSHSTGVESDDATVDLIWGIIPDDLSGIAGYSLSWSSIPSMPPETMTVAGPVMSCTSEPLPPGIWYLNLRTVDRAGNWSATYTATGPYAIQVPPNMDLRYRVEAGWDYVSFPSQGTDNTGTDAHVTPILVGGIAANHFNMCGENAGPGDAVDNVYLRALVDGEIVSDTHNFAIMVGGQAFRSVNLGGYYVSGGRHNFHTVIDGRDLNSETDETNNVHGRQFVWTGAPLTSGVPVQRPAPPLLDAGGEHVPSAAWFVCDGLSFTSSGWWNAVAVRALSGEYSYAARLHEASTGSEAGYDVNLAFSARPQGLLNAVILNRNTMGLNDWDVGVLNGVVGGPDYEAIHVVSASATFGDSVTVTLPANERILLREFYVADADTGRINVVVDAGPGQEGLGVNWLGRTFQTGTLLDGDAVTWTDADGKALLELHLPIAGYYCLVVYRDDLDVSLPLVMGVESGPARPDIVTYVPTGWAAPLVPRPADDGQWTSVELPDTLHGNVASTWINYATANAGYGMGVDSELVVSIDGAAIRSITLGYPPLIEFPVNNSTAFTVRGGRHMAVLGADVFGNVEETDETNNFYGHSWVWSPFELALDTPVTRASPPDPVGGMDEGGLDWFNCDGLRQPLSSGYWSATAVMPRDALANPDLRIHELAVGTETGFAEYEAYSTWGPGESDFVLTNHNFHLQAPYDVGVLRGPSSVTADYQVETVESTFLNNGTSATWGPYTMGAGEIVDLYEFGTQPGFYHIVLESESGTVDWGMSMHRADMAHQGKSSVVDGGAAWMRGSGENEYMDVDLPDISFVCLSVWKRGTADLDRTGTYSIRIQSGLSGVADREVPAVTRLAGAAPNPFNPSTTISYELAKAGHVRLTIYDLTGARVAEVVNASEQPGRRQAIWTGRDARGQGVASGVYLARLTVDGEAVGVTKLALLK